MQLFEVEFRVYKGLGLLEFRGMGIGIETHDRNVGVEESCG